MSERPPNPPELPEEREFSNPVTLPTATPPRGDPIGDDALLGGGTPPAYATEVVNVDDDDS